MPTPPPAPLRDAIALRPCADADAPFLRHLYGTTREDELRVVPWPEEEKRRFLDTQFRAQKTHYEAYFPDCAFLMIELEGRAVGRLYVDRGEADIHIVDIALVPEFRGRGIGQMLLEEILDEARASGRSVTIHVEHNNPARHLYDRLGFRQVDTTGVYHYLEWRPTA